MKDNPELLKNEALEVMNKAGFSIKKEVCIEVDGKLPFMGYTTQREGKTIIVVAGWSLKSDMLMGLLIHELSHVYRIETEHPSHNSLLHTEVLQQLFMGTTLHAYQEKILYSIINNIQDLYADDISFDVYIKKSQTKNLNEFFLGWIHAPLSGTSKEDKWKNAELLVSAAFAQANLERHKVEDTDQKVAQVIKDFLSKMDEKHASMFHYFKNFMVQLPEDVSAVEFRQLLSQYLLEFLKLTLVAY